MISGCNRVNLSLVLSKNSKRGVDDDRRKKEGARPVVLSFAFLSSAARFFIFLSPSSSRRKEAYADEREAVGTLGSDLFERRTSIGS